MSDPQPTPPAARGFSTMTALMSSRKIDVGLWLTRLLTIAFAFAYIIPIFGNSPHSSYSKAFMASAATSALRLHQRKPVVQFTRVFGMELLQEDSLHYLIYSVLWLMAPAPTTVALLPILLFAILHFASFSLTLLDALGQNSWWGARMLISLVELQSRNILRMVAFSEIFLMPLSIVFIFTGQTSMVTPFMYYRFICMRYASRRNPYTRNMFHELRLAAEEASRSPRMPTAVTNLMYKAIGLVSRMAPVMEAQQ